MLAITVNTVVIDVKLPEYSSVGKAFQILIGVETTVLYEPENIGVSNADGAFKTRSLR